MLPNTTPALAVPVVLSWSIALDVTTIDPVLGAWYSTTTPPYAVYLSAQVANDAPYTPGLQTYNADGTTVATGDLFADRSDPAQQPVTPSTFYYFKLSQQGTEPAGTMMTVTVQPTPNIAAPAGSLFISDDTYGFPALVFGAAAGAVLRSVSVVAGENGDILPSGRLLLSDVGQDRPGGAGNGNAVLYDANFAVVTTVTDPFSSVLDFAVTGDQSSRFYIASPQQVGSFTVTLKKLDQDAALLQTWSIPLTTSGLATIAAPVGSVGSLLYWTTGVVGGAVRVYDLAGSAFTTDFAAGIGLFAAMDVVVLSDGNVLVEYNKPSDRTADFVRHYSAAGATLHDYTVPAGFKNDHIARNANSATDFWWWTLNISGTDRCRYQRVLLTDGSVLADFTLDTFEAGYGPAGTTQRFGPSQSCPLIVLTQPLGRHEPTTVTYPIRRLRRFMLPWVNTNRTLFVSRIEIILQAGVGLSTGQGSNPIVMLRWSKDGGQTWSNEVQMSAGAIGEYSARVFTHIRSSGRNWVFEITVSDPINWQFQQALCDVTEGTS